MKRKRSKHLPVIPTTSMGDIAFLLIIFFMICSNFAKESSISLQPPRAADLDVVEETAISVAIDRDGAIFLQGTRVPDAEAVKWGVASLLKDKATPKQRTVMFKCDSNAPLASFESVLESISEGGGIIAALGEKESQ